jgi:hypothetical protein
VKAHKEMKKPASIPSSLTLFRFLALFVGFIRIMEMLPVYALIGLVSVGFICISFISRERLIRFKNHESRDGAQIDSASIGKKKNQSLVSFQIP